MRDHMRTALTALALWLGVICAGALSPAIATAQAVEATAAAEAASDTVIQVANWATASADAHGLPFMVIDKVAAEVFVYDGDGRLQGAAPALLGLARGDASAPGIGHRRLSAIRPDERTTPAGRFLAGFGPAKGAGQVLWIDYASAISIHPVVTANPKEQRLKRLKSSLPEDRRITYGCINVSFDFYDRVVRPTFSGTPSVVYILPETLPLDEVFPALRLRAGASAAPPSAAMRALDLESHRKAPIPGAFASAGSEVAS